MTSRQTGVETQRMDRDRETGTERNREEGREKLEQIDTHRERESKRQIDGNKDREWRK